MTRLERSRMESAIHNFRDIVSYLVPNEDEDIERDHVIKALTVLGDLIQQGQGTEAMKVLLKLRTGA